MGIAKKCPGYVTFQVAQNGYKFAHNQLSWYMYFALNRKFWVYWIIYWCKYFLNFSHAIVSQINCKLSILNKIIFWPQCLLYSVGRKILLGKEGFTYSRCVIHHSSKPKVNICIPTNMEKMDKLKSRMHQTDLTMTHMNTSRRYQHLEPF
jgi:hypothetical protein